MAAKQGVEELVSELRTEVEELRKTSLTLKNVEMFCHQAKEWFLDRCPLEKANQPKEKQSFDSFPNLPNECKSDIQFLEILNLLSEIKKGKKNLLVLKHKLHSAEQQQRHELLNDIIANKSLMLLNTQHLSKKGTNSLNPLALWYAEINDSLNTNMPEKFKGNKFSESSQLFYNVYYSDGTAQPKDLLVESICKKRSKRPQRKKDASTVSKEELQFSTCHKGYCVHLGISRSINKDSEHCALGETSFATNSLEPSSYTIVFDVYLNGAEERLLEYLQSRGSLEEFVRQYVWKEIEKLLT